MLEMDHWQYLIVLGACLLDHRAAGDVRCRCLPARAASRDRAVLPVAAVFVLWDAVAIAAHVWTYNPRFVTGFNCLLGSRSKSCCSSS